MTQAFPLHWPDHIPRHSGNRETGQFRTGLNAALENARKSLIAFGRETGASIDPETIIFSSNVGGLGGGPPQDPGIALWFQWDGAMRCIPIDRYSKPEANLQAIHHIIEADRTKLRHGSIAIVRAAYSGFIALPSPGNRKRTWRDVLGFPPPSKPDRAGIELQYRALAKKRHPDAGGSEAAMAELNAARDEALKEIGQ